MEAWGPGDGGSGFAVADKGGQGSVVFAARCVGMSR